MVQLRSQKNTFLAIHNAWDAVHGASCMDSRVVHPCSLCRHGRAIKGDIDAATLKFQLLSDSLSEAMELQRTWMRLEAVFGSADFQRALPRDSASFADVNRQFRDTLLQFRDQPNALQARPSPHRMTHPGENRKEQSAFYPWLLRPHRYLHRSS